MFDAGLKVAMALPFPFDRIAFASLKRIYCRVSPVVRNAIDLDFGNDVHIRAPLDHPAVFWRYRPKTANRNYQLLCSTIEQLDPGLIIDVGANVGDGAALIRAAGVTLPLLLIEGSSRWFSLLAANAQTFEPVTLVETLLGEASANIQVTFDQADGTGRLVDGGSTVSIETLDRVVAKFAVARPTLLKTDTDGFDAKVLRGASQTLRDHMPVVFTELAEGFLRQQGDSWVTIFEQMSAHGLERVALWDHDGNWLGTRNVADGVADLIPGLPGEAATGYLDVAFFGDRHAAILSEVERQSRKLGSIRSSLRSIAGHSRLSAR